MKLISWLKAKWKRRTVRNLAMLGGLLVPVSMAGTQFMHVPGTQPHSTFAALFHILTLPGQMFAGALDPIFGHRHRQSVVFFAIFITISVLANAFVFGAIGNWWDKWRNGSRNHQVNRKPQTAPVTRAVLHGVATRQRRVCQANVT